MFRSTTIVRELAVKPGQSYIDMKTFNKVMSLIVMRWCGSMSQYGMCTVQSTAHSTHQQMQIFAQKYYVIFKHWTAVARKVTSPMPYTTLTFTWTEN